MLTCPELMQNTLKSNAKYAEMILQGSLNRRKLIKAARLQTSCMQSRPQSEPHFDPSGAP